MSSGDDWSAAADVRLKASDCDEHLLVGERELVAWYELVRRLPAACGCDSQLIVLPEPLELGEGRMCFGTYHPVRNTIAVALLPNPYETIGTLLHEVAHFASNPRHKRHHGYSWRLQFKALVDDLLGPGVLLPLASYRKDFRARHGKWYSRQSSLDVAVVVALTEARVHVKISPGRVTAVAGKRRIGAKVQIPL